MLDLASKDDQVARLWDEYDICGGGACADIAEYRRRPDDELWLRYIQTADSCDNVDAVDVRQSYIHDDQVGMEPCNLLDGFDPGVSRLNTKAEMRQKFGSHLQHIEEVVHHQQERC